MKRAGFTMIELIFVIVILGILAAVAIPKLAATKTDAQATAALSDFKNGLKSIATQSLATGSAVAPNVAVSATDQIAVTATTMIATVGGTKCVTATLSGNDLGVVLDSIDGNCAVFDGAVAAETIPLLGTAITR